MIIKPKPVLLNTVIYALFFIGLTIFLVMRFAFQMAVEYVFFITAMTTLAGLIYGFKLNRNEVYLIAVSGDVVDFSFLNKTVYKRADLQLDRRDVTAILKKDQLHLFTKQQLFGIVRKNTVTAAEWEQLGALFQPSAISANPA